MCFVLSLAFGSVCGYGGPRGSPHSTTQRHSDDEQRRLRVGRVKRASSTRIVGRGNLAAGVWWLITNKSLFKHTRHWLEHQQQQRQFMRLQVCATSTYYYTLICSANVASCGIDTASQTPAARRECSDRSGSGELIMMVSIKQASGCRSIYYAGGHIALHPFSPPPHLWQLWSVLTRDRLKTNKCTGIIAYYHQSNEHRRHVAEVFNRARVFFFSLSLIRGIWIRRMSTKFIHELEHRKDACIQTNL